MGAKEEISKPLVALELKALQKFNFGMGNCTRKMSLPNYSGRVILIVVSLALLTTRYTELSLWLFSMSMQTTEVSFSHNNFRITTDRSRNLTPGYDC